MDDSQPAADPASVRGIVMAGGRSERMRATNGPQHKALTDVAGRSLLERNLTTLFVSGIDDVVVVCGSEPAIREYVNGRGAILARQFNARLELYVEVVPLGNIGVVGELCDGVRDMLVIYVDNLTSIDVPALLARHREASAAMTIATHLWSLRNPFGELEIVGGYIRSYREKPIRKVSISSGTCVIGPAAASLIPVQRQFGAAQLFDAVVARGLPVAAYVHDELWIDVNDADALREAEAIVRANPERFL
jgi:mannose-1-phosphate guanylyltransferase